MTDKQDRNIPESESQNVGAMAGQYAQIAGVLAGFGFTGFAVFLTSARPANAEAVAGSLFSAFAALVLSAILYALLSGEPSPYRRAIGACLYGLPFGLAVITLFQTLTLMSAGVEGLGEVIDLGRVLVVAVGPPIVMARLTIAAAYLNAQTPAGRGTHLIGWIFFALLVLGGIYVAARRPEIPLELPKILTIAGVGLIATVAVGLVSPWVSTRPFAYVPGRWFVVVFLVASFVSIALFVLVADSTIRSATSAESSALATADSWQ